MNEPQLTKLLVDKLDKSNMMKVKLVAKFPEGILSR